MRKIRAMIAGAGALTLASLGSFCDNAGAVAFVRLGDNPDSIKELSIKHRVNNAIGRIEGGFGYELKSCGAVPGSVSPQSIRGHIAANGTEAGDNYFVEVEDVLDLSDLSFSAAGNYTFCLEEFEVSSAQMLNYDKTNSYKIFVNVTNAKDSNGEYTGELVADLVPQALSDVSGEKGEIFFESDMDLTYVEVKHAVEGDNANFNQYFGYEITITPSEALRYGDVVPISGLDDVFVNFPTSNNYQNPQGLNVGMPNRVWLRGDQTLTIGIADGRYRLPRNTEYSVKVLNSTDLENLYSSKINNGESDNITITRQTMLVPRESDDQGVKDSFDDSNKVLITRTIEEGVSTGIALRLIPFVVLLVSCAVGLVAYRRFARKRLSGRA